MMDHVLQCKQYEHTQRHPPKSTFQTIEVLFTVTGQRLLHLFSRGDEFRDELFALSFPGLARLRVLAVVIARWAVGGIELSQARLWPAWFAKKANQPAGQSKPTRNQTRSVGNVANVLGRTPTLGIRTGIQHVRQDIGNEVRRTLVNLANMSNQLLFGSTHSNDWQRAHQEEVLSHRPGGKPFLISQENVIFLSCLPLCGAFLAGMLQLLWNRLAYSGVRLMPDESEHKNILLLNGLVLFIIACCASGIAASYMVLPGGPQFELMLALELYAVLMIGTIVLNSRGHFLTARLYTSIISLVFLAGYSLAMGSGTHFHYNLLISIMIEFFIFPYRHRHYMYAMVALGVLFFLAAATVFSNVPPLYHADSVTRERLQIVNSVLLAALTLALASYVRSVFQTAERYLAAEKEKSERLLLNILPASVAAKLRENPDAIADRFENCTVLFSDIVGFSELSRKLPAVEVVGLLNDIFSSFDDLADKHQLEKIKTIGDAYMVVGGLPEPHPEHAERVARFSLDMLEVVQRYREKNDYPIELRVGISSGHAVAGVIGKKKFVYDLWGDSVNTASRMESHGLPGRVQVTESTYALIRGKFQLEARGHIDVKGMGSIRSYLLLGETRLSESPA